MEANYTTYWDDNTPLKLLKRAHVFCTSIIRLHLIAIYVDGAGGFSQDGVTQYFFPSGNYRITIDGSTRYGREIRINDNRNLEIVIGIIARVWQSAFKTDY